MKKGKREKVIAPLLLALAFLSACGRTERPSQSVEMRQVVDDLGRAVSIPVKLQRAVSLAPSLTEMIFATGAGDRLVGVTTFCNFPEEAKTIQKVGDTMTPNIESIIALKPQVVFVSTASQLEAFMGVLGEQNVAVFVTDPKDLDAVYKNLAQFGDLFEKKEVAKKLVDNLQERVEAVKVRIEGRPPVRVFVQVSRSSLFTIGRTSFMTSIVEMAGGDSVTKNVEKAYPEFSRETAMALNPDAIILSESDDNREPSDAFKNSAAVKNGRVYRVSADIVSRPGPRLVEAIEEISILLHPPE